MATAAGVRKSGRARKPSAKYSIDPFEGLDIGSEEETSIEIVDDEDEDEDQDFESDEAQEAEEAEEDEDLSIDERSDGNASADSEPDDANEVDDNDSIIGSESEAEDARPNKGIRRRSTNAPVASGLPSSDRAITIRGSRSDGEYHFRGIPDITNHAAKDVRIMYIFGSAVEDLIPMVQARDKWNDQATLPTHVADKYGVGGMGLSPYYTQEMRQQELTTGWEWYHEERGWEMFARGQKTSNLTVEEASTYMPRADNMSQRLIMGPYGKQNLFTINAGKFMNFADAWNDSRNSGDNRNGATNSSKAKRHGWLVNIGTRIQCLGWVPNKPGSTQYLAVSVLQKDQYQDTETKRFHSQTAPAFAPAPPTPASIQIWAFESLLMHKKGGRIDSSKPPRLEAVLCFDWGDVKQFKWCPMPVRESEIDSGNDQVRLGLLAGIWGDGKVRILDISYTRPADSSTQYIRITSAAFEVSPPDTVCSCLTWLSSTTIAVGCANGCLAIWNIPNAIHKSSGPSGTLPWFYHPIHHTYIFTITSAYPSRPTYIITTSMDGYIRATDMRAPFHDFVLSQRSRVGQPILAWHEATQSAFSADENYAIRGHVLRRFYANTALARVMSPVVSLAVSPVHPFVLIGCADGYVVSTNPLRKTLSAKANVYQQIWFGHEWRRGVQDLAKEGGSSREGRQASTAVPAAASDDSLDQSTPGASTPSRGDPVVLREPLIRITDGYKVETMRNLHKAGLRNVRDGVVYSTIYEEKTAITQVCWNPNLHCGGWAAAGTGSGLLRVEDIAL